MINSELAPVAPAGAADIEAWLQANARDMRVCTRLPGHPRVTTATCQRRQRLAWEIKNRNGNESLFDGGGPVGLESCLDCPDCPDCPK